LETARGETTDVVPKPGTAYGETKYVVPRLGTACGETKYVVPKPGTAYGETTDVVPKLGTGAGEAEIFSQQVEGDSAGRENSSVRLPGFPGTSETFLARLGMSPPRLRNLPARPRTSPVASRISSLIRCVPTGLSQAKGTTSLTFTQPL
jgi:hypothetical protein